MLVYICSLVYLCQVRGLTSALTWSRAVGLRGVPQPTVWGYDSNLYIHTSRTYRATRSVVVPTFLNLAPRSNLLYCKFDSGVNRHHRLDSTVSLRTCCTRWVCAITSEAEEAVLQSLEKIVLLSPCAIW